MSRTLHRYSVFLACMTFILIIAGGLVTSTGSGLAVPDWPLSFGQVFPRMEGGVLFEHGHRLLAATIGVLTVILAVWTARVEPRRPVRILGWAMLGAVILQGVLGGVTVLLRLPDAVSVAHAGLAQLFFASTVVMATMTGSGTWEVGRWQDAPASAFPTPHAPRPTSRLALWTAIAIYCQILLGAIVRHTGAGLVIPGFPTANGRLIPEFTSILVVWQFAHRVMALIVALMVAWLAISVFRHAGDRRDLVRPAAILVALTGGQIFLGALTIWTWRAVTPTTAHVATGALVFATSVLLAVRAQMSGAGSRAAEPALEATPA